MSMNEIKAGDIVSNARMGLGRVVAVSRIPDDESFVVYWFRTGHTGAVGHGWRRKDLAFVRTAHEEKARREARKARETAQKAAALFSRMREAAGLPDWHSDEIHAEIQRIRACDTVAAYRTASREGAQTPLGAKQKIALYEVIHG